jgi:predicted ATPase
MRTPMLKSLRLQNLLSFGPDAEAITLGPLNVIIGPNGSGKSNFIEAIGLLAASPRSLRGAIREGGGVGEWLWKGGKGRTTARIEAVVDVSIDNKLQALKYELAFTRADQRLEVVDERIEDASPPEGSEPMMYFGHLNGRPTIRPSPSSSAMPPRICSSS